MSAKMNYIPAMTADGRLKTDDGPMTPEEYKDYVDDYLTEAEAEAYIREIRRLFNEIKAETGITDIRFTTKGQNE